MEALVTGCAMSTAKRIFFSAKAQILFWGNSACIELKWNEAVALHKALNA